MMVQYGNLSGKTFILGVGAQKAGTTWLYHYLNNHPSIAMSAIKEMHFWDQKFRPDLSISPAKQSLAELKDLLSREANWQNLQGLNAISQRIDLLRTLHSDEAYFEYFDRLAIGGKTHMGEITPSYSLIGKEGLKEIKRQFESRNIRIKVVFLMRNPVDRYYSALRMFEGRGDIPSASQSFASELNNPWHFERTRYDRFIESLLAIFDAHQIFMGFYETMFHPAAISKLCHFLEVSDVPANFEKRMYPSPLAKTLSQADIIQGVNAYADVYRYCIEYFGNQIPADWLTTYALCKR